MEIVEQPMSGLFLLKPRVFGDERGYFFESFNQEVFNAIVGQDDLNFVQDNQSLSQQYVLRGMHFQVPPHAQGKLVRVTRGAVKDVVVDLRRSSETFGQSYAIELSGDNFLQLYIPEGFAHGFLTLEDQTLFQYKCTAYYHHEAEDNIHWNDPDLAIEWGVEAPIVSEKDRNGKSFAGYHSPFD